MTGLAARAKRLARLAALRRLFSMRASDATKVPAVYAAWGPDTTFRKNARYYNLGCWEGAEDLEEAAESLAFRVVEAAEPHPSNRILDVGCGFGDAGALWLDHHFASDVIGVNVTLSQLYEARRRHGVYRSTGLSFAGADATRLPFKDEAFDRVIALESSFHFLTRDDFFREGRRVLAPGGWLVCADIVPRELRGAAGTRNRAVRLLVSGVQRLAIYPSPNAYGLHEYRARLLGAGFAEVHVESIRDKVYVPLLDWLASWAAAQRGLTGFLPRRAAPWLRSKRLQQLLTRNLDYVIAVARNPFKET